MANERPLTKPQGDPNPQGDALKDLKTTEIPDSDLETVLVDLDGGDDDIEIKVVDDTPKADRGRRVGADPAFNPDDVAELEGISETAKQRIGKLGYEFNNERRAKEDAQRKGDEALRFAQAMQKENEGLRAARTQTDTALASSMTERHEGLIAQAKTKLVKAHEDGDGTAIADAQSELARFNAELVQIRVAQPPATQAPAPPATQAPAPPATQSPAPPATQAPADPKLSAWIDRNKSWFHQTGHEGMTGYALGLDQALKARGIDPNSEQYYREIDAGLRETFPAAFAGENAQVETTTATQRGAPVAAPSNAPAGGGRKKSRQVRLTRSQLTIARQLQLTDQQYAAEVARQQALEANQ